MSFLKPLRRCLSAAIPLCGVLYGARGNAVCESEKYHAWRKMWHSHRQRDAIPGWDPGCPTTATKFLNECDRDEDAPIRKILIPLCGASHDMDFIQRHFRQKYPNEKIEIIGIELSEDAVQMFLERVSDKQYDLNGECTVEQQQENDIVIYRYDNYSLIAADILNEHLRELEVLKDIDLIYDKESLAALPPPKWHLYIAFCEEILSPKGKILFSAWRYDTNQRDIEQRYTAPFSFGYRDQNDLVGLYSKNFKETKVEGELLCSEKWDESPDLKDYFKFKADILGIRGTAFTDVWLLKCNK